MLHLIIPGFWSHYSQANLALLTGDLINWMHHTETIFPKTAKCLFEPYGPSGSTQQLDAFCLLPINVLNQKLFTIIWLCYIMQIIVSISDLLYWLIVYYSKKLRIYILYKKTMKSVSYLTIHNASCEAYLGHFFVLNQIAKNTNTHTFIELISELATKNVNETLQE